jgi:hypothetical protein
MKKTTILFSCIIFIWSVTLMAQEDELIFSHQFHHEDGGADCTDCHDLATSSLDTGDNLLPAMETCYTCHDEDDTECTLCHTNSDNAMEEPRIIEYSARFAHKTHIDAGEECITCHTGIIDKEKPATENHIPGRDLCTDCHGVANFTEEKAPCLSCHGQNFIYRPENHMVSWRKDHGLAFEIQSNSCNHCHSKNYCIDCHEGDNLDHEVHPLNYRISHGIEAKANKENCLTCHREFAFCNDCHRIELVMPKNHSFAGWSNTTTGGQHARQAQFDFDYCQSCHSQANSDIVCIKCHGK